jgi:hypothetical protein
MAYSTTNKDYVYVESGTEHDLVRKCDRDPEIKFLVSQPFELSWGGSRPLLKHTPDLLTVHSDGSVTVWDARPSERQGEDFIAVAELTRETCLAVGWAYTVFGGLGEIERLNLLWLHGFRRCPQWLDSCIDLVRRVASRENATLGDLFAYDGGAGELTDAVWYLVWNGTLIVDLERRIESHTLVILNDAV